MSNLSPLEFNRQVLDSWTAARDMSKGTHGAPPAPVGPSPHADLVAYSGSLQPVPADLPPAGPPAPPVDVQPQPQPIAAMPVSTMQPQPAQEAPGIPDRPFPLIRAGGGVVRTPEREMDLRGPTLRGAQGDAAGAQLTASDRIAERNQQAAAVEYDMALQQQREAQARQQAMEKAAAERDAEMQDRIADFDTSTKALSQSAMDPDRFWSSRSTGQKVAGLISVALGGFLQGTRGGSNPGLDMLNQAIDRDMKAQEFEYFSRKNQAEGKQTAFAMAMQKYQNVDAAKSMARAASLDAMAGQVGQMRAMYAGTDAANRADATIAQLMDRRKEEIQQGIRFLPSQTVQQGPVFIDPRTGVQYTNKEAQGFSKDFDAAENKRGEIALNTAGSILTEGAKAEAAGKEKAKALTVTLPNGDTVRARGEAQATALTELAVSMDRAKALAAEAKAIRENGAWRAKPAARAKLEQIQADLVTQFGVQNKLGALSNEDMKLAVNGTADLFQFGPGVEARLERMGQQSDASIRRYVRTMGDGAPDSAKGKPPVSFTKHGGK
jgi:hypothetical protein